MKHVRGGRFFKRDHERHATAAGRVSWHYVRAERGPQPATPDERRGPYESAYDVAHGYASDRSIIRP